MVAGPFAGDKKKGNWVLAKAERRMVNWLVPKVPRSLETYHLTMLTVVWSIGIVIASFLARENVHWLWLVSAFIGLQYLSDALDGAVGRYRNTGLVKWGFYMDHFLDYLFLASIIVGYGLVLQEIAWFWFMSMLVLGGAFMTNMFLSCAATNEFQISALGIGPTEMRLFFILVNAGIVLFGTGWLQISLPFVLAALTSVLVWLVFKTQKQMWRLDMEYKAASQDIVTGDHAGS